MITFKNLTLRNFLSIGAVTQAVNFDQKDLTLILGKNCDVGGDNSRNGTGKTTLIQGLSYALFGVPINSIRKDNLVNRTNAKNMLVTLEFNVNGVDYKIERGRKPNLLRFYINNVQQKDEDTAQGENKATQEHIERVINMTPEMFGHIVVLNTYTEPFLAMKNNDQRVIIEQLLGITLLSEKAETVKKLIRASKDAIQQEEFRVKAVEEANKRVREQVDSVKRRQSLWQRKHDEDLASLVSKYETLTKVDIDAEMKAHKDLVIWTHQKQKQDAYESLLVRQSAWIAKRDADLEVLNTRLTDLSAVDIVSEIAAHSALKKYILQSAEETVRARDITRLSKDIQRESTLVDKLVAEIATLEDHKCYACGQDFHDEQHTEVLNAKNKLLADARTFLEQKNDELVALKAASVVLGEKPKTHYSSESEAIRHSSEVERVTHQIAARLNEVDPYAEQLTEQIAVDAGIKPITHYSSEAEAIEHRGLVSTLEHQIEVKVSEVDPYAEQVHEMETKAIQSVTFDKINELTKTMEHQVFLLDLLTSKDSFVRKRIIDQSLKFLNGRLQHYLDQTGLPHQVVFKNDLQVEITELGRELDFFNLSRGEMNRVILSLSWAFRDVWENLYQPINALFIDELLDSGMDASGIENAIGVLKDMTRRRSKSIWVVSHRDELVSRVNSVLKVVKEGGFTTYSTSTDTDVI